MLNSPERTMPLRTLVGALGLLACVTASAQVSNADSLDHQIDGAFRQVLQQPQDLAGWSQYAQLLIEAGNYEGGIAALERLLLDPQAPPALRVDIAALYYRLGSYAMAEGMLRDAVADPRLQGDKRDLAEALLADTLKRNQRSQLRGAFTLGLQAQTNPTFRSDSDQVLSSGALVPQASSDKPSADQNVTVGLRINHFYDLEQQNAAAIVTNFGAYLVNYGSSSGQLTVGQNKPYNLQLLDFNSGVQFKPLPAELTGLTLRPHVILANMVAQEQQYLANQGLGLDMSWQPNEKSLYQFTLDGQVRDFANRADVVNADQQNGHLYGFSARASHETAPGQTLIGEYFWRSNRAENGIYDFNSNEIRATYSWTYASPLAAGDSWTTSVWLGALDRTYGIPNPAVSATDVRHDSEWRIGANHTVPLAPLWSLILAAEYSTNQANQPNFRYQNTMLSGSVVRSF